MKAWISKKIAHSRTLDKLQVKAGGSRQWMTDKLDSSGVYIAMQDKLAGSIEGAFESVIDARRARGTAGAPVPADVHAIIERATIENSAISAAAGLVPGPWGMVAVVPEIAAVVRNQIAMVYDIGVANGKEAQITKELLAGIVLSAVGTGAAGLLVTHGGKVLVRRASLQVFQRVVVLLAGSVSQQALKAAIGKWLPVVGAVFMAWLSGHMTRRIGHLANEIFGKEIDIAGPDMTECELPAQVRAAEHMPEPA